MLNHLLDLQMTPSLNTPKWTTRQRLFGSVVASSAHMLKARSPTCANIGRFLERWGRGASGKKLVAGSLPLKDTETLVPSFLPGHQEVSSLLCHELPVWWAVWPQVHHNKMKWPWTNISETTSKNRSLFLVNYYFIISVKANKHTHLLLQVSNILTIWELGS